jgi:hypothetical protein
MLLQQLQKSGLPQQLPSSLAAVTARLQEVTAAAQQQTNSSSSSSSSRGTPVGSTVGSFINLSHIAMLAAAMLHSCEEMASCQAEATLITTAAAAPAFELALTMLRYADMALQQQQQQQQVEAGLLQALMTIVQPAWFSVLYLSTDLNVLPYAEPQVPTITLGLTLAAVLTLCHDHMEAMHLNTSSSSSSGSTGDVSSHGSHGAWLRVCQLQQQQQLVFIPVHLLELLGLSQQLVSWLAAVTPEHQLIPMKGLCVMWCQLLKVPQQQQQQQLVVHLMLSTVVLGYVGKLPTSDPENVMKFSVEAQQALGRAMQRVWDCYHALQRERQQQQGEGALEGADASDLSSKAFSSMQDMKYMYGRWLTGALPGLLDIMSNLLQIAQPDSSSSGAANNAELRYAAFRNLRGSVIMLASVAPHTIMEDPGAPAAYAIHFAPAWAAEGAAEKLMAVLEGYARLTAAAAAAVGGGQLPVDGVDRMQHWSGVLVGGRLGVLQLVVMDDNDAPLAGVDYEGPFLSLLFSMLRLAGSAVRVREGFGMQQVVCNVLWNAVDQLRPAQGELDKSSYGPAAGAADGDGFMNSSSNLAARQADGSNDVLRKLPCVVLFGRCCALLADSFVELDITTAMPPNESKFVRYFAQQSFAASCDIVAEWLRGAEPQLSAAGYRVEAMQQQLGPLGAAAAAAVEAVRVHAVAIAARKAAAADVVRTAQAAVGEFVQQLRAFATAAAAVAVPNFCNNPSCGNASGVSEAALVSGRSCICSRCRIARYCSRECQVQHWKQQHKLVCQALAAAAAAAAAGAGQQS